MNEIFRNDHFIVRLDSVAAIVEVVRTGVAFTSAQDASSAFRPMLLCLDNLGRARHSLLFDARTSVANNNPDYEAWYAKYRAELVRDFRRVAILMLTPVGSLQATRLLPTTAASARVFLDPDHALSFVSEPNSVRSVRFSTRDDAAIDSPRVSGSYAVHRDATHRDTAVDSSNFSDSRRLPVPRSGLRDGMHRDSAVDSSTSSGRFPIARDGVNRDGVNRDRLNRDSAVDSSATSGRFPRVREGLSRDDSASRPTPEDSVASGRAQPRSTKTRLPPTG